MRFQNLSAAQQFSQSKTKARLGAGGVGSPPQKWRRALPEHLLRGAASPILPGRRTSPCSSVLSKTGSWSALSGWELACSSSPCLVSEVEAVHLHWDGVHWEDAMLCPDPGSQPLLHRPRVAELSLFSTHQSHCTHQGSTEPPDSLGSPHPKCHTLPQPWLTGAYVLVPQFKFFLFLSPRARADTHSSRAMQCTR
jgi:hypothetical protein